MSGRAIDVPTAEGFSLEGLLDGDGPRAVALCHPHPAFGGTMDTPLVAALAGALSAAGLAVLRFNFRGVGGSGGEPSGGLAEERDVAAAVALLRDRGATEIALCGYSFGSLMAAKALGLGLVGAARFLAVGLPTAIIGHDMERIAGFERVLDETPTLLVAGTRDQFCDVGRLRAWIEGRPHARLVELPGVSHFFTAPGELDDLVRRSVEFLATPR